MTEKKDNAVSPVVGVMLMLVVTIVLAALVAAFAGGLGSSTEATPVVTLTADASRTSGLLVTFTGISTGSLDANDISVLVSKIDSNEFYEIPLDKFTPQPSTIKSGTTLIIDRAGLIDVVEALGDTATKPSYITGASVYDTIGGKIIVEIANENGVIGTTVTELSA